MALHTAAQSGQKILFGLIFFSSNEASSDRNKYHLVIDSARFADQHGFSSIWIPERHFTRDGWLYPNPAVLQAAIARETTRIGLRAGSVVMPLHNPLRVAEEWAMVDNLSNGRVGISFASGWHPNDFALLPENYNRRNEEMYRGIEMVRKLWRGEKVEVKSGDGSMVALQTYPTPIQKELPFWVTAAGNPRTFEGAGKIGANLLTHMYNQNVDELAAKIRIYRDSLAQNGFDPAAGQVSVMLHTFIARDEQTVRAQAQGPFIEYLKSASYLVNAIAYSRGQQVDLNTLSEQDLHDYLLFVFDRLVSTQRVLFGTPASCLPLVQQLQEAGVNEIACQMDFGVPTELVLESLPYLNELKEAVPLPVSGYTGYISSQAGQNGAHSSNGHQGKNGTTPERDETEQPLVTAQGEQQLKNVQRRCRSAVDLDQFYRLLDERGIGLGASFRGLQQLWRGPAHTHEALGEVQLPSAFEQDASSYQIHPTLLDACNQVLIAALPEKLFADPAHLYLPTGIRSFRQYRQPGGHVWSHAQIAGSVDTHMDVIAGDVHIYSEQGELLIEMLGLQLQHTAMPQQRPATTTTAANTDLQQWLYELQWQTVTIPQAQQQAAGRWLIFQDGHGVGKALADLLVEQGQACISVHAGTRFEKRSAESYVIDAQNAEHMRRLLEATSGSKEPLRGAIHLWSLDSTPLQQTSVTSLQEDQRISSGNVLHLLQQSIQQTTPGQFKLWLVTQGAQPVTGQEGQLSLAQAPLWGFGKTCAMEHPELWGGLVDLDAQESAENAAYQLLDSVLGTHAEDLVAFRQGQSYGARMVRSQSFVDRLLSISPDGSYLITGGLWGLGLEVARWLVQKGARNLVLLGRSELPPRETWDRVTAGRRAQQIAGMRDLESAGAHVHYAAVDVADETQLNSFLQQYARSAPPVRGVIHAASVWQDTHGNSLVGTLSNLTVEGLEAVFRPKVIGSWLLHQAFKGQALDFFVSFSSGASLFGSAGQGNYAAAGEFLDVLAYQQRQEGQRGLSIDWGAISQIGFGGTAEGVRVHEYWEAHGIQRITPQQVLAALELLIPQDHPRVGVLKLDWQQLQQFYPQIGQLALVSGLVDHAATPTQGQRGEHAIRQAINDAVAAQRQEMLEGYLAEQVAAVLRMTGSEIDVQQPLTSLGLDSLMAIELKNRLETELTIHIPIVTFLQGPSIAQFAAQLLPQLVESRDDTENAANATLQTVVNRSGQTGGTTRHTTQQIAQPAQQTQYTQHNLAQLDQSDLAREESRVEPSPIASTGELNAQEASALLAQLDNLSDEEVDALLKQMAQQEEDQ